MEVNNIPDGALTILNKLNEAGYDAYLVGGCVRDLFCGYAPKDWDICTSALSEQTMKIFSDNRIIETGLQHGTVTVVLDDGQYEITTYRIDGDYTDARHPNSVTFTADLFKDLSRRDFTMNAMALNPSVGFVDLYGGLLDVQSGILKCVGNPNERFSEDALRILRAMRFASTYNLALEEDTLAAMHEHKDKLSKISMERISSEIIKMCSGSRDGLSRTMKVAFDCLKVVCKELDREEENAIAAMIDSSHHPITRLALIFDIDLELQKEVLKRMKFSNEYIKNIQEVTSFGRQIIIDIAQINADNYEYYCKKMLNQISYMNCIQAIDYAIVHMDFFGDDRWHLVNIMDKKISDIFNSDECYQLKQLSISGKDVASFGFKGKEIGVMLNYLLDMVMNNVLPNDREALLNRLDELKGERLCEK